MTSFAAVPFCYRPGATAAQMGFTFARADSTNCARYRDINGVWQVANANVLRDAHYHWDGSANNLTTLREGAGTNIALGACSFADGTYWTNNTSYTITTATSCIAGQTAYRHAYVSGLSNRFSVSAFGTFVNGQTDCFAVFVERTTDTAFGLGIYDVTAATDLAYATLTWATKSVAITSGSGTCGVIDLGTGPNGGTLLCVWVAGTGTAAGTGAAGNSRKTRFSAAGAGLAGAILHHAQFEAASSYPSSPIVTVAGAVTRAADLISAPWTRNPEAGTWYADFYDLQGAATGLTPCALFLGSATAQQLYTQKVTGAWKGVLNAAAGSSISTAAAGPSLGNRVELRHFLTVSGANATSTLGQSINGAAEAVAAAGNSRALDATWSGSPPRLYIGVIYDNTLPANLAIRALCYVPYVETMANMRIYATTAPIMPWVLTTTNTLAPAAVEASVSSYGQPKFTVEDTGTATFLSATATPGAGQSARMFNLRVSYSAAPLTGTVVVWDGMTRIWRSQISATGPFEYEYDFSRKPLRSSKGNDLTATVDTAGGSVVQTVMWTGDFVRAP